MIVLGLGSSIAIARIFGVNVIGEYALTLAPVGLMTYISSAQEQAALVRELSVLKARAPRITGLVTAVQSFSLGLTLLVAVPVTVVMWILLEGPIGQPELVWPMVAQMASYVVIQNTCLNADMVLTAFRAGRELFWIRLIQALAFVGTAVGLGFYWDDVWALVIATVASWGVSLIHRLVDVRHYMRFAVPMREVRDGFRALPSMLVFGLKTAPGTITDGIASESGTFILGITGSVGGVGAWSRARQLGTRLQESATRVNEIYFPTLCERRATGDREGHDRALMDTLRYMSIGFLLAAAAGGGAATGVMNLFGPGFDQASDAFALILLAQALAIINGVMGLSLWAADKPLQDSAVAVVRSALVVGLSIPLAIGMGVTGPALGTVIAFTIGIAMLLPLVQRMVMFGAMRDYWPLRHVAFLVMSYVGGFLAARLVDDALPGLLGLTLGLPVGAGVFAAILVLTGGLNERDRARLSGALSRFRGGSSDDGEPPPGPDLRRQTDEAAGLVEER